MTIVATPSKNLRKVSFPDSGLKRSAMSLPRRLTSIDEFASEDKKKPTYAGKCSSLTLLPPDTSIVHEVFLNLLIVHGG